MLSPTGTSRGQLAFRGPISAHNIGGGAKAGSGSPFQRGLEGGGGRGLMFPCHHLRNAIL